MAARRVPFGDLPAAYELTGRTGLALTMWLWDGRGRGP